MTYASHPHRRYNILTDEWVLVSPHRTQRPWQGAEEVIADERPSYDPTCYLCPNNQRAGGHQNPDYQDTFVFTNDFSAVLPEIHEIPQKIEVSDFGGQSKHPSRARDLRAMGDPRFACHPKSSKTECFLPDRTQSRSPDLLRAEAALGECRVICFSPRHDLTLARMSTEEIHQVILLWQRELIDLEKKYQWVQIFENKGQAMGCSNPHPHGQIWATQHLPTQITKEDLSQLNYYKKNNKILLLDYAELEIAQKERVMIENQDWLALVPFWAVWPYEILLLPKLPIQHLPELNLTQQQNLAEILKLLLAKYNKLFNTDFPYSMGWHGRPNNNKDNSHWQLHAHFYPPLLRSASVKKFMVGYEMLAEPQRDLTPEAAAERLRNL